MRKSILIAGVAAAFAATAGNAATCNTSKDKTLGTVVGAVGGVLLGRAIDSHGSHTAGTIVGGVGGAVAGNQIAGKIGDNHCDTAYGYYDDKGAWHATSVSASAANGYYDRDGRWVSGQPSGYYDQNGRWTTASNGYRDANGRWVPSTANGYYDESGRWYEAQQTQASYRGTRDGTDRRDVAMRESRIEQRIRDGRADGSLSRTEGQRATAELASIRRQETQFRADGQLSAGEEQTLQGRLDRLSSTVRMTRSEARNEY